MEASGSSSYLLATEEILDSDEDHDPKLAYIQLAIMLMKLPIQVIA